MEPTTLQSANLPASFYYMLGVLLLSNLGIIVSVFYTMLKASWWLSKLDSRVTDAKSSAVRAHKRIDGLE